MAIILTPLGMTSNNEGNKMYFFKSKQSAKRGCHKKVSIKNKSKYKPLAKGSLSTEQLRPKKRPRSDDPFGLNQILGLDSGPESSSPESSCPVPSPEAIGHFDLNLRLPSTSTDGVGLGVPIEMSGEGVNHGVDGDFLWKETIATVNLGLSVGAQLGNFEKQVCNIILDEGIDMFNQ
ncbi:hypothetical protein L1987_62874 [Smallanthus sonchifolius]|uniref:Uncharacterized protein n=1 Tax=Smallanthus sonchifolius TaxID=185202 RepID=A0ACB9CBT0_9ASTR|nr:hypothetical protein L1987_62874 [Smallanthus sonchifolius]